MARTIVIQFATLDGVIEDPDGSGGTPFGGWAMRHGPEAIGGDKFQLGELMTSGILLFGRRTWDHFGALWSPRTTEFALAMNAAEKAVVTSRPLPPDHWSNSRPVPGVLADFVADPGRERDLVVIGSTSVVRALATARLVDEYRVLTFPTATGSGAVLFPEPLELELESAVQSGPGTLAIYRVPR